MFKLLCVLYFCSTSFGSFTGVWIGDGKFVTKKRQGECHEVFFKLSETPTTLELVTGGYNCSMLSAEYPNSKFEKKDGDLISDNQIVGKYSDSIFMLFDEENQFKLTMTKSRDGLNLDVKEEWGDENSYLIIKSYLELE